MPGLIERIGSLAGTEAAKAVNLAHSTYQERMSVHSHIGRALIESAIAVARAHPNLVGIGVALIVEQLLVEEHRLHDSHVAAEAAQHAVGSSEAARLAGDAALGTRTQGPTKRKRKGKSGGSASGFQPPYLQASDSHLASARLHRIRPGRVALEVFGAIILLKLGAIGARMFRRKHHGEVWFAPAADVHIFSATIAAYNLAAAMRSPGISAWRNGAIAFFGTDALKPLLKVRPTRFSRASAPSPEGQLAPPPEPQPTPPVALPEAAALAPQTPSPPQAAPPEPAPSAPMADVTPFAPNPPSPAALSLRSLSPLAGPTSIAAMTPSQ